ncbi:TPA: hypothetical protein ACH3X1_012378 [Trebouxia sp. C0004]
MTPQAFQCFVLDLATTNPGMSSMLEHKRAATKVVYSLGLQADLRARAVVLVVADSTVGNSLRDLIPLNEDDPALKALVEEFFRGGGTGKAMLRTDNTQFSKVLTADVLPMVLATYSTSYVPFIDVCCLLKCIMSGCNFG